METATKNKRGRPAKHTILATVFPEKEPRTAQNLYYAAAAIKDMDDGEHENFFVTPRGKVRRQGIAEQVGRMYEAGLIGKETGKQLLQEAIDAYNAGDTVKDIERRLSFIRRNLKNGGGAD